ncbi:hypothetical protein GF322_05140 [Candidatus Dependentiae bacterium]|nr:hypothetical protein [Candidatus Dependentiae bacterium]
MRNFFKNIKILVFLWLLVPGFLLAQALSEQYKNEINSLFGTKSEQGLNVLTDPYFPLNSVQTLNSVVLDINPAREIDVKAKDVKQEITKAKRLMEFLDSIYSRCLGLRYNIPTPFVEYASIDYLINLSKSWPDFYKRNFDAVLELGDNARVKNNEVYELYVKLLNRAAQETKDKEEQKRYKKEAEATERRMEEDRNEIEQARERLRKVHEEERIKKEEQQRKEREREEQKRKEKEEAERRMSQERQRREQEQKKAKELEKPIDLKPILLAALEEDEEPPKGKRLEILLQLFEERIKNKYDIKDISKKSLNEKSISEDDLSEIANEILDMKWAIGVFEKVYVAKQKKLARRKEMEYIRKQKKEIEQQRQREVEKIQKEMQARAEQLKQEAEETKQIEAKSKLKNAAEGLKERANNFESDYDSLDQIAKKIRSASIVKNRKDVEQAIQEFKKIFENKLSFATFGKYKEILGLIEDAVSRTWKNQVDRSAIGVPLDIQDLNGAIDRVFERGFIDENQKNELKSKLELIQFIVEVENK